MFCCVPNLFEGSNCHWCVLVTGGGAGMNCASLWLSAAMDLCVWRAAAFSGEEDGREVVADMEMEARVWEVEGDDVATCYWLNFELLDHDTWHYIIG